MDAQTADALVRKLALFSVPGCFNPYAEAGADEHVSSRRRRLTRWLTVDRVRLILVTDYLSRGSSPISGIPLVSESLMRSGVLERIAPEDEHNESGISHADVTSLAIWNTLIPINGDREILTWALAPLVMPKESSEFEKSAAADQRSVSLFRVLVAAHPDAEIVAVSSDSHGILSRWISGGSLRLNAPLHELPPPTRVDAEAVNDSLQALYEGAAVTRSRARVNQR